MSERRGAQRESPRAPDGHRPEAAGLWQAAGLWLGLALLAAYALPLLAPPGPQPYVAPTGGVLARLFPGVPPLWIVARLLALAAGGLLVARALVAYVPRPQDSAPAPAVSRPRARLVLAIAAAHAAASLAVPLLGRAGQVAYVVLLFLPAAVLAWGAWAARTAPVARPRAVPRAAVLLVACWIPLRFVASWRSPRAADPIDTWLGFQWLSRAAYDGSNLLSEGLLPGQTALNQLLQGVAFIGPLGIEPSFRWLQLLHLGWVALAALGVAWLAARRIDPAAAPVAAGVVLFSPFTLLLPLNPSALFIGLVFTTGILVLLEGAVAHASGSALLALAALAGMAASNPALAPFSLVAVGVAAWSFRGGAAHGRLLVAAAALVFFAALAPALPRLVELPAMVQSFTEGRGEWAGLEAVLLGQRTPFDVPALWQAGSPGPVDVPLGALLAPFAIPRQSIRLWGDTLFDPLGAALAAVGIALLVLGRGRGASARLPLALLAVALLPGFVSSYDRASLTRLLAAPVLVALLAGLAFEALRRRLAPARPGAAALFATLAVALGGTFLFDFVNPRILRASWLGIAIESLEPAPPATERRRAGLVTYGGPWDLSWLHVEPIAAQVPRQAIPWLPFESAASLALPPEGALDLLFWSPALEADARVSEAVCARWPEATLYTLWDRPRLARALAAEPGPGTWRPGLPAERFETASCAER